MWHNNLSAKAYPPLGGHPYALAELLGENKHQRQKRSFCLSLILCIGNSFLGVPAYLPPKNPNRPKELNLCAARIILNTDAFCKRFAFIRLFILVARMAIKTLRVLQCSIKRLAFLSGATQSPTLYITKPCASCK